MHVSLLGPVSAQSAGAELGLGGLKQRAVFALLALNAGRVVSLDRLVDELWPEEPPARATLGLQSYVSRLRRVLGAAADADPEVPALVTRPPGWVLDLDRERVDATRFEQLVARARQLPAADARPLLCEALGLWRGDPLGDLQSVPFAREEAARLTELRLAAQETLLEAALGAGDPEAAVAQAHPFVTDNPYRERGWRALALGLYRTGRQSEGLAALTRLRRLLADELGLDPSPETRELEAGILRQDPALTLPSPDTPDAAPAGPVPGRQDGELLGREAALATVDEAVAAARSGRGSLLVLEAPAGAGKTTLLRAITKRITAAGGSAAHGSGVGAGAVPALWPWVTVVRQVAALLPPDAAPPSPAAAHALDVLAAGSDGAADAAAGSRTRLYRGVIDLLLAAAAHRPLAVVLDDVQWVDADSLDLLALAVDELIEHAVVLGVAVRTGEPGTGDVTTVLRRTRRDAVFRLPLPGLGVDDVGEVVRALSGRRPPDAEVTAEIHRRTLGNPFFVGELVRLLASEQRLDQAGVREALPDEVEDVLRRRLDRLPQQTVALLAVVALAGGPVDVDTLAAVTGLDPDTVLDACESALLAELLVEDGPAFVLRHDLVRQTLERGLSHARRARLHARLAEAIQARPTLSSQDVVSVSRHLAFAEPVVGPAAAIPFLLAAADDALSRNAHREAERLLLQSLDLAGRTPDPRERATFTATVRGRLAIATRWGGRAPGGEAADDEFVLPGIAESPTAWANALINRGLTGHYEEAAGTAEEALRGELEPSPRAQAHFVAGWAQLVRGRLDDADGHFRAFEELHDTTGDLRPLGVAAAGYAAVVAHCQGDEARADRADRLARARAARHEESTRMEAELYTARLMALRGDAEKCREAAGRCAAVAERIESPVYAIHAQVLAAWADAVLGDASAADRADEAYLRVAASGVLLFVPFFLLLRAEAHAVSGRPDRAAELVAEATARSAELGEVPRAPRLLALADELAGGRVQASRKP